MEYINEKIEYPLYDSRAFSLYFGGMDIGVLDIETTGLSPKNSAFVLGGLVTPIPGEFSSSADESEPKKSNGALLAEQFFAESLSEEQAALKAFWDAAGKKDVLITFNGQHFDLPFMRERAPETIKEFPYHLDLYLMVKKFSPIRKFLPNLKQKSVENYMGLWQYRKDEISGKDSVDLYYRYLSEKTDDLKRLILLHNHDDILQLYRLLKVLGKTEIHKAMFHMGFPIKSTAKGTPDLIVENIKIKPDQLIIKGRQTNALVEYSAYEYNGILCHIHFSKTSKSFRIDLPVMQQFEMTLLDMEALGFHCTEIEKYPSCREGFLILEDKGETNYLEINHFTKLFIERMTNQWITNR